MKYNHHFLHACVKSFNDFSPQLSRWGLSQRKKITSLESFSLLCLFPIVILILCKVKYVWRVINWLLWWVNSTVGYFLSNGHGDRKLTTEGIDMSCKFIECDDYNCSPYLCTMENFKSMKVKFKIRTGVAGLGADLHQQHRDSGHCKYYDSYEKWPSIL